MPNFRKFLGVVKAGLVSHTYIHTYIQTDRQTYRGDLIGPFPFGRSKIRNMETKPEQTVKQIDNPNNAQKNAQPAQRETGKDINEMKQMKNFLVDVMAAISAFDQKLSTQLDTNQIHTDRS